MKIFKTFITILIVLFSNICLQSQSVFEIEIDNIFIDKQGIAFVNKDEENSFLCNLTPIMKRDFEYDLVLDCDEEDFGTRNESSKSIEFSELKEFELPEQLIEHIRNTKFVKMSNQTETKYIEFLQIFDDNLITQLSYWNSKNGYQYRDFSSVQFKDYTFIRINKKYIIIAIMYEEDPEPRGYIIPKKDGFIVLSEKRIKNTDTKKYAEKIVSQIDSLIKTGVKPNHITIVGTSKGGYIAQYVSTFAKNPNLNFVFIGSFQESDINNYPEINFCGNILTIYEKTDVFGVTAIKRKETSKLKINQFKEIELNTGLKHGFLYIASDEWIKPCKMWAKRKYEMPE